MNKICLAAASLLVTQSAFAELGEEGFGGNVGIFAGYESSTSNFNTDNATIKGNLNKKGKSESDAVFLPFGNLTYTFGDDNNHQVMLGTDGLGYLFEVEEDSVVSLMLMPGLVKDETWQDPYVTGSARKKTDVKMTGFELGYENFNQMGTSVTAGYFTVDVDKEKSGSNFAGAASKLKRDGKGYNLGISQMIPVSDVSMAGAGLSYEKFSADGKAMSYNKYGLDFTYMLELDAHMIMMEAGYFNQTFSATNPVFNKKQKNNGYFVGVSHGYEQPFDWENWYIETSLNYSATQSNINFYDTNELSLGVALSYEF